MANVIRRFWIVLPIVASTATQCDETPRGAVPTPVAQVELVLNSVPASPPSDSAAFDACLDRWRDPVSGQLSNHVRPSWRASASVPDGDPRRGGQAVELVESSPNRYVGAFFDVPVGVLNVVTVHDRNECAREPAGDGHVAMGVFANGTELTAVVGQDGALAFQVDADGTVTVPAVAAGP